MLNMFSQVKNPTTDWLLRKRLSRPWCKTNIPVRSQCWYHTSGMYYVVSQPNFRADKWMKMLIKIWNLTGDRSSQTIWLGHRMYDPEDEDADQMKNPRGDKLSQKTLWTLWLPSWLLNFRIWLFSISSEQFPTILQRLSQLISYSNTKISLEISAILCCILKSSLRSATTWTI